MREGRTERLGRFNRSSKRASAGGGDGGASFVGVGTLTTVGSGAVGVDAPNDSLAGDLLIAQAQVVGVSTDMNTPAGWDVVGTAAFLTSGRTKMISRIASGDGAANDIASWTGAGDRVFTWMAAFRGVDTVEVGRFAWSASATAVVVNQTPDPNQLEMTSFTPGAGTKYLFAGSNVYNQGGDVALATYAPSELDPLFNLWSITDTDHQTHAIGGVWDDTATGLITLRCVPGGAAHGFALALS
jgi:hypothetical protein